MKIAQVSPLYESVPPKLYGGTERVVSFLTEELVREGHDVTLFASADSVTSARLVSSCRRALRLSENCRDPLAYHLLQIQQVSKVAHCFDIIHFHIDYLHFALSRVTGIPQLTTLHGRLDLPDLMPLYLEFADMPVVSISKAQQKPLSFANWVGNVYHGIPKKSCRFYPEKGEYLAFLGRMSPEKRPEQAIDIAIRSNTPLKLAAKVDPADREFFTAKVKPLLNHPLVEYIGEIDDQQKNEFLGRAKALLFPIDWPEPFGLVVIESLACGTPVIAYNNGSVPEILDHNKSGYIVHSIQEAAEAVGKIGQIDRHKCREIFETRFSSERMAKDYLKLYEKIIATRAHRGPSSTIPRKDSKTAQYSGANLHSGEFFIS